MPTATPTKKRYRLPLTAYKPGRNTLLAVARYHHLTADQVCRLLFAYPTSMTYAQKWLRQLTQGHLLTESGRVFEDNVIGGSPFLWGLTMRGRSALQEMGIDAGYRTHHVVKVNPSRSGHLRALNDVLIHWELLARDHPGVELVEMRHEQELAKTATTVSLLDGTKTNVASDGWVHLRVHGDDLGFALELDRGTEGRIDKWLPKVRALLAFGSGPYREVFGLERLTIAVVVRCVGRPTTKSDDERLRDLMAWTENELEKTGLKNWGTYFKMTIWDAELTPAEFFGSARWRSPFDPTPKPLIGGLA